MDILLTSSDGGALISPISIHGMLWLQTHFEDEHWAALANDQVKIPQGDAKELVKDAAEAGVMFNFLPSPTVPGRF
ncbi:hypothetical protein [Prochlorococcus sp. MIT 1341]|uniref:hypothetical protein n=1 Tax=Prochlorococcus sp. MIT 1341 TaxID=3096221 RepID=UPI002A75FC6F|nr:hypothetical protein [Prochlorococcus sp. MIT 1341]